MKRTRAERREILENNLYYAYDTLDVIAEDFDGCFDVKEFDRLIRAVIITDRKIRLKGGCSKLLIADLKELEPIVFEIAQDIDNIYFRAENNKSKKERKQR